MKKALIFISFSVATVLLLAGCGKKTSSAGSEKNEETIPVKVIALTKTEIIPVIHASGQFTTDDETILSFKTGGVINKIFVREGESIKKGQILATLNLAEISAQVNQAKSAAEKASRDYQRVENLYHDSVTTLEQLQNAKTGMEIAQQQLSAANFNLSYSEIRATNDGVVLKKVANEGQIVGPGMPVIQTSSKGQADWILRVNMSDREWAQINLNDKALVNVSALNLDQVEGFVYSKSENADMMTGSFSADIKLKNAKALNIASGMFGKVEISCAHLSQVWAIPYEALLDGNANTGFVFVTKDNHTAVKVPVKISGIEKNTVLISEGLENYSSLIVSGSAYLTDQSPIQVIETK